MSAELDLTNAYQEWRQLAEKEGEAIQAGDWMRVCDCQNALQQLQPRIIRYSEEAQQEWARLGADRTAKENRLREQVKSLIELEWRNHSLLDVKRQAVQAELTELARAGFTLRRIQRHYAPARGAAWTSFS
jgi:hypothetical protein